MIYLPLALREPLSDSVESLFYLRDYHPEHAVERLVPDGMISLVIELDGRTRHVFKNETGESRQECVRAWVSGMQREYISISALPETELLAVRFKPGRSYPFLQLPVSDLNDRVVPAEDVFGPDILGLRERLGQAASGEQKLQVAAGYLEKRYDPGLLPPAAIADAVAAIVGAPTVATLDEILPPSDFSQKHFISLFKKFVGLTPKMFQRVLRFSEVIPLINTEECVRWAELSVECGYYDQAHFIRDFRAFSGVNPQSFFDEDHDRVNFFPAE